MRKLIYFFLVIFSIFPINSAVKQVVTVQPKIMVIPYTKEGEDIRTILESDVNKRVALTKIKEAFDKRGFTTVDFLAKLKSMSTQSGLAMNQQLDLKAMIIQQSGADIYVEAETNALLSNSGNSVKILITAYDISTGNSLSNKVGESGKFYTEDIGKLASKVIEGCADEFLNIMQTKFSDIVENGRSINMTIGFSPTSSYTMATEVGSEKLSISDEIELWIEKNAYKNNYHIQGTTDMQMLFDDIRIPLKDKNGKNYNVNKFGLNFLKFMRTLGLQIERSISNNSIVITIK